jgi:hypothetical protein
VYRANRPPEDVDAEALSAIVARVQRLSRRVIALSLGAAVALGAGAVFLTLDGYHGPGGKILGARLGLTFCVVAGITLMLGGALRRLLIRRTIPRWINEMVALGFDADALREELAPFVE